MPSRIIRDTYPDSLSLRLCSPGAEDRYPRYWLAADDFGCFELVPSRIKGNLFTYRPDMTEEAIACDLGEYEQAGMLETWVDRGRTFGFFRSWCCHQRIRPEGGGHKRKTSMPPSVAAVGSLQAYHAGSHCRHGGQLAPPGGHLPPSRARATATATAGGQLLASEKLLIEPPAAPAAASTERGRTTETPGTAAPARPDDLRTPGIPSLPEFLALIWPDFRTAWQTRYGADANPACGPKQRSNLGRALATWKRLGGTRNGLPAMFAAYISDSGPRNFYAENSHSVDFLADWLDKRWPLFRHGKGNKPLSPETARAVAEIKQQQAQPPTERHPIEPPTDASNRLRDLVKTATRP